MTLCVRIERLLLVPMMLAAVACGDASDRSHLLRPETDEKSGCYADQLAGCPLPPDEKKRATTSSAQFFEQSTRRDATPEERSRVAKLLPGCTSFFLENTVGKTFMATARHCVNYSITTWCESGGKLEDNDGQIGSCTRIIAADRTHDIAVFEANLKHASQGPSTLKLSRYPPAENKWLVMVGYPAGSVLTTGRRGELTTTQDCWTLGSIVNSPHAENSVASCNAIKEPFFRNGCLLARENARDLSLRHNCTTYGGNSGGPMYLEGTRLVVGLPFTYLPDDYTRRSSFDSKTAAHMALMFDFITVHEPELKANGIVIETDPDMANAL